MSYAVGMIGLGVMGRNLALNLERNGYAVAGYDLDAAKAKAFREGEGAGKKIGIAESLEELARALEKPRRIMMMVPGGAPVDSVITGLRPHLERGDILIDGGNSHFKDPERRNRVLEGKGIRFVGTGVSGGEAGARWGPSLMPGGQVEAWENLAPMLRAIAAKAEDGEACGEYMGPGGAGHYVKMVHNGIEYAEMQLIAEVYDLLHRGLGLSAGELHKLFAEWNTGELKSYLIGITADIFRKADPETGLPLVDMVLDEAEQKGTGKWASQNALEVGAPIPTIHMAVDSRILSSLKGERVRASKAIRGPEAKYVGSKERLIDAIRGGLYAGTVIAYAQGLGLLRRASAEYGYGFRIANITKVWRAGSILSGRLLEEITAVYRRVGEPDNLLLAEEFRAAVEERQVDLRSVVRAAVELGIPAPALSASLAYYDAYRSERLPANLTQAQRDYFGAHSYRRSDREGSFHTNWQDG